MTQLGRERSSSRDGDASARPFAGDRAAPGGQGPGGDLPLLNALVATLANLDFAYDEERRKVGRTVADPHVRLLVLERLKRRHWEKRDPYVRQLAILRERIREAARESLAV